MKRTILLAALILSACQTNTIETQSQNAKLTTSSSGDEKVQSTVAKELLISPTGIGKAQLGMTLGRLKQISDQDTKFDIVSPFTVDVNAIAVSKQGLVQYYILYVAGTTSHPDKITPTDDDPISILMTNNDNYQTSEGVKVGTPIKEAEEIYGNAVLAYNTEGESREYITFGNENPDNIRFRASYFKEISNGLGFSGIYADYPGASYATEKYRQDAAIAAIEVSCTPNNCPNSFQFKSK